MIRRQWFGGEHAFALNIGQLRALQQACDAGPEEILGRIWSGTWRIDDLLEIIRLGLIGGGDVEETKAGVFVTGLLDKHPLLEFKPLAQDILMASLIGDEGDPVGEPEGAEAPPESGSSA